MKLDLSEKSIVQNLIDGGVNNNQIDLIISKMYQDRINEVLNDLSIHRSCLLEKIHAYQKNIAILDEILINNSKCEKKL